MKIYLAGTESSKEHSEALTRVKAPFVLMSFYHGAWKAGGKARLQPAVIKMLSTATDRFIDSGAFTIRASIATALGRRMNTLSSVDIDEYLEAYIRWLHRIRKYNLGDWWVELDLAPHACDFAWQHHARKELIKAGLGSGLVCVWHQENSFDDWMRMLEEACLPGRSRYVAIEGHAPTRKPLNYNLFLKEAYKRGVRVHGFKMTKADDLRKYPFYSTDSTTWLAYMQAGSRPAVVRQGGVVQVRYGKQRKGLDGVRAAWHGNIPKRQDKQWRQSLLMDSARIWIRQGAKLAEYWKHRGVDWEAAIENPEVPCPSPRA